MNPPEPPPTILPLASPPPGAGLPSPASGPQDAGAGAGPRTLAQAQALALAGGTARTRTGRAERGATGGAGVPSRVHIRSAGAGVPDPAAAGGRKRGTRPTVFEIRDLCRLRHQAGVGLDDDEDRAQPGHRGDRTLGLWQVDVPPLPQPDERLRAGLSLRGQVLYHGEDLYAPEVNPAEVRRRIGMVFQKPNPFPKSIYDNVACGAAQPRAQAHELDELVEQALRGRPLGRGQGPAERQRGSRCPAASSSGCASPAPSRSSPT